KAREYEPLVIHYNADNGAAVRLGDVAKVSDSVEDVRNAGFSDDLPAVLLFEAGLLLFPSAAFMLWAARQA
ncbi:hypothetical protein, partial [Stenotrophomonas maltophilia]|uniref:hypothetical protein n=1 Tax=Stenotrophomonas maltophilia TaxID=40324 RepID=UPI0013DBA42D